MSGWALLDCAPSSHLQAIKGLQDGGQHWHNGAGDEMQIHKAQPARHIHVSVEFRQHTLLHSESSMCRIPWHESISPAGALHNPTHGKWWWMELTSWSPCQTPAASASPSCKTVLFHEPVQHSSRRQSMLLTLFIGGLIDWACRQGSTMLNKVQASQQVCCQTRELAAYHWDSWRFSETLLYLRRKSASSMCLVP